MGILDYVIIGLLFVCLVYGLINGAFGKIYNILCFVSAITVAVYFSYLLASLAVNADFAKPIVNFCVDIFDGGRASVVLEYEGMTLENFNSALISLGRVPNKIANQIAKPLFSIIPTDTVSFSMASVFGKALALIVATILSFILIYFATIIVLKIVGLIIKLFFGGKFIKFIDRILGMIYSLAICSAIIFLAFTIVYVFKLNDMPQVATLIDQSMIGKFIYNDIVLKFHTEIDKIITTINTNLPFKVIPTK